MTPTQGEGTPSQDQVSMTNSNIQGPHSPAPTSCPILSPTFLLLAKEQGQPGGRGWEGGGGQAETQLLEEARVMGKRGHSPRNHDPPPSYLPPLSPFTTPTPVYDPSLPSKVQGVLGPQSSVCCKHQKLLLRLSLILSPCLPGLLSTPPHLQPPSVPNPSSLVDLEAVF